MHAAFIRNQLSDSRGQWRRRRVRSAWAARSSSGGYRTSSRVRPSAGATLTALTRTPPVRTSAATRRAAAVAHGQDRAHGRPHHGVAEGVRRGRSAATMPSGPRVQDSSSSVRAVVAPTRRRQRPRSRAADQSRAASRAATSSGRRYAMTSRRRSGSVLRASVTPIDVPAPQLAEARVESRTGRARGDAPYARRAAARTPAAAPRPPPPPRRARGGRGALLGPGVDPASVRPATVGARPLGHPKRDGEGLLGLPDRTSTRLAAQPRKSVPS